jgi:zinc protease
MPLRGTPDSVKAIAAADLRGYVRQHLGRDNLVVAVTGDITPARLGPLLDSTFGALPAKAEPVAVPDIAPVAPGRIVVVPSDNPQSTAMFGEQGIKRDDPDWYAAYVMNYILGGGGFSSWLTEEVREKRGLAYSVYSYLEPFRHAGIIIGGVATQNARMGESVKLIREQWARMRDQGPSEQELADAKTYLVGSFPLMLDSTTSIANLLVTLQLDHLGIDYLDRRAALIEAVTMDDVRRAAKRLLDPQALAFVIVGKPDGVTATK